MTPFGSVSEERFSALPGESGSVADLLLLEPNEGLAQAGSNDTRDVAALTAAFHFTGSYASPSGATMQEYFVQSSVSTPQQHDLLLTRLRGLSHHWIEFCDQETVLHLGDADDTSRFVLESIIVPTGTAGGGSSGGPSKPTSNNVSVVEPVTVGSGVVSVRLRRSLRQVNEIGSSPVVLRYLGAVETDKGISRRSSLETPVTGPSAVFLRELGFQRDYTYVAEGHLFVRGRVKVLIYTVNDVTQYQSSSDAMLDLGSQTMTEPLAQEWTSVSPHCWLVEIVAIGSPSDESLQDEVSDFVDLLHPLITPAVVDYSALLRK